MNNEMQGIAQNVLSIRADSLFLSETKRDIANGAKHIALVLETRLLRDLIGALLQTLGRGAVDCFDSFDEMEQRFGLLNAPDLVVTSITDSPEQDMSAIRAMRTRMPSAKWLVLSRHGTVEIIREALDIGVSILLLDESPSDVLKLATEMVLLGHSFIPAALAQKLYVGAVNEDSFLPKALMGTSSGAVMLRSASSALPVSGALAVAPAAANQDGCSAIENRALANEAAVQSGRNHGTLSDREMQILACLTEGCSNKLIARRLNITEATVKVHVKALLRKMQVSNRTQAALSAGQFLPSRSRTL